MVLSSAAASSQFHMPSDPPRLKNYINSTFLIIFIRDIDLSVFHQISWENMEWTMNIVEWSVEAVHRLNGWMFDINSNDLRKKNQKKKPDMKRYFIVECKSIQFP